MLKKRRTLADDLFQFAREDYRLEVQPEEGLVLDSLLKGLGYSMIKINRLSVEGKKDLLDKKGVDWKKDIG